MASSAPIISIRNLAFRYDRTGPLVLQDITLDIPAGTATALLGPNGSGKTTLLSLLLGILTPQEGTIQVAGQPRGQYGRRELSRLIGLVPQQEFFPIGFSVLDYVLLGRAPYLGLLERPGPADYDAAEQALERVGLAALSGRLVPSLSGGERQLAMVARALAQEPRVLLMDEPTSHLDLGNRRRVLDVIRALSAEGVSVVLTTHDPNAAASVAGHAMLMRQGRVIASAPVDESLTTEHLTAMYDVPVEVVRVGGQLVVLSG
jgi:iron complex transport system ATP-binding protein